MRPLLIPLSLISLLLSGAIFGFFYAWVCSTMWGLDRTDPNTAIAAMQAMNASVRNATFAPAFFATPFVLLLTGFTARRGGARLAAASFTLGGLVYLGGGLILTMMVNVPLNEALAQITLPLPAEQAAQVWQDYSAPWQVWNQTRTVFSGLALLLCGCGLLSLSRAGA